MPRPWRRGSRERRKRISESMQIETTKILECIRTPVMTHEAVGHIDQRAAGGFIIIFFQMTPPDYKARNSGNAEVD